MLNELFWRLWWWKLLLREILFAILLTISHPSTLLKWLDATDWLQEGRPEQRNASDAAALAAKVAKKAEMKQKQEADAAKAAQNKPVVRKKTNKKEADNLDDLLSAGLSSGKGKKKWHCN